ncbi:tripartite tricarboxylate transporter substrate binding protein [Pseudooceanicola nitratireducens]|uniref:Bug family tripartite tricarboxylate transporter substrate binding protein n=1 Tax=Pseudooceanicola nitratireducens TaxID=517719 RepID=UPI001C946E43|nr:tripartite tricarboxylate transporter substrate binding protein [Pseudooceanicola nitratireducens]MBY6166983.1 tripartite tricarboxylate transporter substrate binding protein [Pseudooceanicola nitratireducens]
MTEFNRRNILAAAGFAIAAATTPFAASAQSGDPIHLIVPYGGGGLIDGLVRQIGDMMSAELDQPVVVENKPGSNGIIGATYAAAAKPDGLTYFIGATGPLSLNVLLRSNLTYDLDSFVPVGTMMSGPLTVTVPASMGVSTLDELKAKAVESGQPLRYATLGPGSVTHLFGMVLQDKLGVPMVDVAYRNNPSAIVDLIGGQNDLNFSTPISLVKHEEAGDLKMLAISTEERHERFPDLPTTTELGYPDLVSSFWFGVLAPAGTPEDQIARVSAALQNAMKNEELQTKMTNVGMTPHVGGPDAMQAQLDWDQEFWGGVIKENNITLE